MNSRKGASVASKSAFTVVETSTPKRPRGLQQKLSNLGNYFVREAKVKRLCADALRTNGYTAEAREYAGLAARYSFLGKDFIKRANSLASPAL